MQLYQKRKIFAQFYFTFSKFRLNFEHFLKKGDAELKYFVTYLLRNRWSDKCLKSPFSKDPAGSNMVNWPKHCSKLDHSTSTIFIDPFEGNSGLKSLSEWYGKIFGLLVKQLTAGDKYSLYNWGNWLQHFQMPLSQKRKIVSKFFFAFSKFTFLFEHFLKKYHPHIWCIFKLMYSKKPG